MHRLCVFVSAVAISGCGGGSSPGTTSGTPVLGRIYVTSPHGSEILRFDLAHAADGNWPAAATITHSSIKGPRFLYLDVANDRLYVASNGNGRIVVYDQVSTISGAVNRAPDRSIVSPAMSDPVDVALDPIRDELYVSNRNPTASTLGGDGYNVLVFSSASSATGSISPSRTISSGFDFPHGILYDPMFDRLYVCDSNNAEIKVFDSASARNGAELPTRTIYDRSTPLLQPLSARMDSARNLVVTDRNGEAINVYLGADAVSGNVTPLYRISGIHTALECPHQIFYVESTDELYVANAFHNSADVWAGFSSLRWGTADVVPTRSIQGDLTGLFIPEEEDGDCNGSTSAAQKSGSMGVAGIAVDVTR